MWVLCRAHETNATARSLRGENMVYLIDDVYPHPPPPNTYTPKTLYFWEYSTLVRPKKTSQRAMSARLPCRYSSIRCATHTQHLQEAASGASSPLQRPPERPFPLLERFENDITSHSTVQRRFDPANTTQNSFKSRLRGGRRRRIKPSGLENQSRTGYKHINTLWRNFRPICQQTTSSISYIGPGYLKTKDRTPPWICSTDRFTPRDQKAAEVTQQLSPSEHKHRLATLRTLHRRRR